MVALRHMNMLVILSNAFKIAYSYKFRGKEQELNAFLKSNETLFQNSFLAF